MEPANKEARRVLIVDDEAAIRESLGRLFQLARYEVHTAASGRDATAWLAGRSVDVVLLDVNMPDENGWETARRLAALCPSVPVLMITGWPDQRVPADLGNVVGLMDKPLDLLSLLGAVSRLCRRAEEHPEAEAARACQAA
jgi:two-component system response regulator MprA